MKFRTGRVVSAMLLAVIAAAAYASDPPTVSDAWARATPPGINVGAAYLVIKGGDRADRVVAASTPRATMVDIHEVVESAGVAKMRPIAAVEVPPRATVILAPQGTHLMLMGLDAPLVAGQSFPLTLQFAESPAQTVTVAVRAGTGDTGSQTRR